MKYIRTKNNVYENLGLIQSNSTADKNSILVCGGYIAIRMSNIIKQADTIEKVCDVFVVVYNNGRKNLFALDEMANEEQTTFEYVKEMHIKMCKENPDYEAVYAAIWTDRGLIYVAKMNDDGELELL